MNRRLDTRVDSNRAADRVIATTTTTRTKHAKSARTDHKTTRPEPHATKPADVKTAGASMDYQMGFTSGPSV